VEVLRRHGIEIELFRDIRVELLTEAELKALAKLAGGVVPLFSTRATLYRELGLGKRNLSEPEMIHYMMTEWTLVRRPIMVTNDGRILIGGNVKAVTEFVESL
jgi:arsenate reductase